jgi:hypothetical protein
MHQATVSVRPFQLTMTTAAKASHRDFILILRGQDRVGVYHLDRRARAESTVHAPV